MFSKKKLTNICLLGLVSALGACDQPEPLPEIIRPVRYIKVTPTNTQQALTYPGSAKSGVVASLSFKVAGTLQKLSVKVGDEIEPGQVIAKLDPTDFELQVQEVRALLVQANAELRNAEANYTRVRELYENNNASRSDLDAARAAAESATAAVDSNNKKLQQIQRQVGYSTLKAPNDCAIASVNVEVNENVQAGQSIVTANCGGVIEVEVGVPESIIPQIKRDSLTVVRFDAIVDEIFDARVSEVAVALDASIGAYPVTVQLSGADSRIRSGMSAEVEFRSGDEKVLRVPPAAVGEDGKGRFVYVALPAEDGFGNVQRRAVEVGSLTAGGMEVKQGLSTGDLLVVAGVTRIVDGQKVRLPDLAAK